MRVGRSVSSKTQNNESFTVWDPEGSDECTALTNDAMWRVLSAPKLLSILDKGETVDAAGSTRGACWSGGEALTVDLKIFVFVCQIKLRAIADTLSLLLYFPK